MESHLNQLTVVHSDDNGQISHPEGATQCEISPELLWGLAFSENRHLVRFFDGHKRNHVSLPELARYIATQDDAGFDPDLARVAHKLHQDRLPQLEELGVITYDPRSCEIRYTVHDPAMHAELLGLVQIDEVE